MRAAWTAGAASSHYLLVAVRPRAARLTAVPRRSLAAAGRQLRRPGIRLSAIRAALTWLAAGVTLFICYLQVSRTVAVTSDGAANALQAWDMLHHNLLLHGWQLSDVSFYTTELPQYMLIEAIRGLSPDVVHVASAMTYTLLILLAALLAKSRATGREAIVRCVLVAGIMLAPQVGSGVYVLVGSPDHVGSAVPVLALFVAVDRLRRRWVLPLLVGLLLTWAQIGDPIVLLTGVLPLISVALIRLYRLLPWRRGRFREVGYELALGGAALGSAFAAPAVLRAIASHGGFTVWPVSNLLTGINQVSHNLRVTVRGLVLLFGANFFSQTAGFVSAIAALHLIGIGLAAWAVCKVIRRFADHDHAGQLLVAAVVILLFGYLVSTRPADVLSTRDLAAVLPFSAALAGRVLTGPLTRARLLPALAVVLVGYVISLGRVVVQPPASSPEARLASWLASHHLTDGLTGYWDANSTTLVSGGGVRLRSVLALGYRLTADYWEIRTDWFDPRTSTATFVVLVPSPPGFRRYPTVGSVRETFGQPLRIYYVGSYTILVWNKNLLADIGAGVPATVNPAPGAPSAPGPGVRPIPGPPGR